VADEDGDNVEFGVVFDSDPRSFFGISLGGECGLHESL
jgi:hypothetical protein